jgi:hypothetical protein
VDRVFVVAVADRLELKRAVLDVEMPGEALGRHVEHSGATTIGED